MGKGPRHPSPLVCWPHPTSTDSPMGLRVPQGWMGKGTNILPLVCCPHPTPTDSPMGLERLGWMGKGGRYLPLNTSQVDRLIHGLRVHRDGWGRGRTSSHWCVATSHVDRLTQQAESTGMDGGRGQTSSGWCGAHIPRRPTHPMGLGGSTGVDGKGDRHPPAGVLLHIPSLTDSPMWGPEVHRDGWGRGRNILPLVSCPQPTSTDSPMGLRVHRDEWGRGWGSLEVWRGEFHLSCPPLHLIVVPND
ncbi:hypothetical protein AVEN_208117-1 [Araneus ventricosus]|uniref:Uncharacterized protein n=1 Tax=Araneus ventricosus TaxID=182803 RepID=A0A4Y2EUJ9_ARAVE|nr:hypothetical protein AVEN_208117-1 [Araneus ventricosus]